LKYSSITINVIGKDKRFFLKVLLLIPDSYTYDKTLIYGFRKLGHDVVKYDFRSEIGKYAKSFNTQSFRLPFRFRSKWQKHYITKIDVLQRQNFDREKPDIVFVYNSEMLLPETLSYFKSKGAKLIMLLGDSPYYTPINPFFLQLLPMVDLIVSPDSMWINQLFLLGIKHTTQAYFQSNPELFYPEQLTQEDYSELRSDVLFIGNSYVDSWGYKRALFVDRFKMFDLKIYGTANWTRWFKYFPDLEKKFTLIDKPLPFQMVNKLSNGALLYPVDTNPGLINGIHLRTFDCIASGVLPLLEYKSDIEIAFPKIEIPYFKSYDNAELVAKKYISNDQLRERTLKNLQDFVATEYRADKVIQSLLDLI
jgi:spore maturation protein CgeB